MRKYVFSICEKDDKFPNVSIYNSKKTFDDPNEAIRLILNGEQIAVLDAYSLECYGTI